MHRPPRLLDLLPDDPDFTKGLWLIPVTMVLGGFLGVLAISLFSIILRALS